MSGGSPSGPYMQGISDSSFNDKLLTPMPFVGPGDWEPGLALRLATAANN